jgi:hypothetical protein
MVIDAFNYQLPGSTTTVASPVTGAYLAHNHLSLIGRAFLAADLHRGALHIVDPLLTQCARVCGVNYTYAHAATKRQAERADILSGVVPLVPRMPIVKPTNGMALPASITGLIRDSDLIDLVRKVGPDRILDIAAAVEAAQ